MFGGYAFRWSKIVYMVSLKKKKKNQEYVVLLRVSVKQVKFSLHLYKC